MTIKYPLILKILFYIFSFIILLLSWKLFLILILFQIFWRRSYKLRFAGADKILQYKSGQYFSPVHGKIIEVFEDDHRFVLKVRIGIFSHKGFYALADAEVDSVELYEHAQKTFSGRSLKKLMARTKYRSMHLGFVQSGQLHSLSLINTSFSLKPSTIIMPGDRVRYGAHLGWIPLGGIILIELPKIGKLLVKEQDPIKMFITKLLEKN